MTREKFNQEIWWILQEIKKDEPLTQKGERVEFLIRTLPKTKSIKRKDVNYGFPHEEIQIKLLYKLKEWKAIDDLEPVKPRIYKLSIKQLKFNEIYRLYESGGAYPEDLEIIISKLNSLQSIIKPKALELIAKEISAMDSGSNLVEFLVNCGVKLKFIEHPIEYPNTNWKMVYAVLLTLANSPNPKDQKILFKIIEEASHPLMHDGDEKQAKKYEDKFNKLLSYDGLALRNYKLKKITKEAEQDNDLDLYLKKKILVENWRDDLPHPINELSFNNNTLEQICYSLWNLFVSDIISFGANTFPEDILVETDPRFHQEIAFNWNLIRDLDNNPHKLETDYGFDIEILDEKRLKKSVDEEITEFVSNKVNKEKIEGAKDFYPDTKFLEIPSRLRGIAYNYYAYKKQKEALLNFIAVLYEKFENEILVIKFDEITDKNINVLRTLLALEKEGFFSINELRNDKKEWTDKDNVFAKVKLIQSKISTLKKFIKTIKSETKKEATKDKQKPIPIQIVSGKMEVEGLQNGLKAIAQTKKEDKNKFPYKLPAGTKWEDITIKFLDDENVFIQVKQFKHNTNYKEMGLIGKGKTPKPSELWTFLKVLAQLNGELSIRDPQAKDKYKKQKELLSKALQSYFLIDYDPFYPYRSSSEKAGNSYKIKITLIPPPQSEKEQ